MDHVGKRVLVIAHEPDGPAGQIEVRLVERGFTVVTHVVTRHYDEPQSFEPWPEMQAFDLIAPMGSVRSLVNTEEIDTWVDDELDQLRHCHVSNIPILGICFGGQLMAKALGGSVELAPVTEIGWFEIQALPGSVNPVGPGPWKEWHHDRFNPPADAQLLAVNENAVQMFRLNKTVGTQFHPEVDGAHIDEWLSAVTDDYLTEHGVNRNRISAEMAEHEARNIRQCHALVDWFLDEVAFP